PPPEAIAAAFPPARKAAPHECPQAWRKVRLHRPREGLPAYSVNERKAMQIPPADRSRQTLLRGFAPPLAAPCIRRGCAPFPARGLAPFPPHPLQHLPAGEAPSASATPHCWKIVPYWPNGNHAI